MVIIVSKGSVPTAWRSFRSSADLSNNVSGILLLLLFFLTELSQQCQNSTQYESRMTERLEVNEDCRWKPQEKQTLLMA